MYTCFDAFSQWNFSLNQSVVLSRYQASLQCIKWSKSISPWPRRMDSGVGTAFVIYFEDETLAFFVYVQPNRLFIVNELYLFCH
ncbi:hypothetical protein SADUNF_Sadunf03G0012400 [Salix dunnii]|uniref:Uncharacterized protein n=1 Tax=Salix dunnii TaxID=1413687 RepID=A0A835K8E1_9ROSI|nr:hypothetical protein SADUNF_Sadunf03G0012400 [Salix dunnii]